MKLIDGMLCRDTIAHGGIIVFFKTLDKNALDLSDDGIWGTSTINNINFKEWTLEQWKATYDLKPPAPGKCFAVEIEL
jgi:hypothetical protein